MLTSLLLASQIFLSASDAPEIEGDGFDFYFGEFVDNELPATDKMRKLISQRLAETFFEVNSDENFRARIGKLQDALEEHPERLDRFTTLDRMLQGEFDKKIKKAKQRRLIYSAAGAIIGALVAFPIAKFAIKSTTAVWLSIPIGALAGGGAGFLLGHILEFPKYKFSPGLFTRDLDSINEEMAQSHD